MRPKKKHLKPLPRKKRRKLVKKVLLVIQAQLSRVVKIIKTLLMYLYPNAIIPTWSKNIAMTSSVVISNQSQKSWKCEVKRTTSSSSKKCRSFEQNITRRCQGNWSCLVNPNLSLTLHKLLVPCSSLSSSGKNKLKKRRNKNYQKRKKRSS